MAVDMPVVYLDTNHISTIVRSNSAKMPELVDVLWQGKAALAFSVWHMVELSDPGFRSFDGVCRFLDSLPIAWAVVPPIVWDMEVEAALAKVRGDAPVPITVFYDNPAQALRYPNLGRGLPSTALEALRESPHLREMLLNQAGENAADFDVVKTGAVAVKRPHEPVLALIRDYQLARPNNPAVTPEKVLSAVGGLAGFPSYHLSQALNLTRLKDLRYVTERNDILDEWHAAYAPYVDVMVLDRRTVGRVASTKLPVMSKITRSIDEVPGLLSSA